MGVCLDQLKAAGTGSGLSHPHQNDPLNFRLHSPFLNQGQGVWGVGWGGSKPSPVVTRGGIITCTSCQSLTRQIPPRTITGGLACAYPFKTEFSFIYFWSKSHIDTEPCFACPLTGRLTPPQKVALQWHLEHNDLCTILRQPDIPTMLFNPLTHAFALLNGLSSPSGDFCVLFCRFFTFINNEKKKMNKYLGSCIHCWPLIHNHLDVDRK